MSKDVRNKWESEFECSSHVDNKENVHSQFSNERVDS